MNAVPQQIAPSQVSTSPLEFQFKPTRQPMLWAALAFAGGIIAGAYAYTPPSLGIVSGAAFIAAGAYFSHKKNKFAMALALASVFLAGAVQIQFSGLSSIPDASLQTFAYGSEVEITAHVTREGRLREAQFGELREVLDVQTQEVAAENGNRFPVRSGVRLSIYGAERPQQPAGTTTPAIRIFHYGERIRLPVKLKLPRNFRNPGAFDYQSYLAAKGIGALASARAEDVQLLPGFSGSHIELWRSGIHSSIVGKIHELWPARQAALIDAMVIGEDAFIDRDTRIDFQRSGTYHILVVSGMNVTILAFVVFWSLRRLHFGEVATTALTILCCIAYAFLIEVGPPVWRATLMCAIFLATRLLYRERGMVNALGAAALGLLVFDPRQLLTASFQMTFLCVLVVAAIALTLLDRTSGLYRRALAHWDADDYGPLPCLRA